MFEIKTRLKLETRLNTSFSDWHFRGAIIHFIFQISDVIMCWKVPSKKIENEMLTNVSALVCFQNLYNMHARWSQKVNTEMSTNPFRIYGDRSPNIQSANEGNAGSILTGNKLKPR